MALQRGTHVDEPKGIPILSRRDVLRAGALGAVSISIIACGGTVASAIPSVATPGTSAAPPSPAGSDTPAPSSSTAAGPDPTDTMDSTAAMQDLIKQAQAEYAEQGALNLYTSIAPGIAAALAGGFTSRYGILVNISRQVTAANSARITAEAESGEVLGDIGMLSDVGFVETGTEKGWLVDPTTFGLPAVDSFPKEFVLANTGYTQATATYQVAYNSNLVTGADIPTKWTDVLDPKWKGRVIIPDPRGNSSTLTFFYLMQQEYGDEYLTGVRDLQPSVVASSVTGLNSLGAGDASLLFPNNYFVGVPLISAGAPIGGVDLFPTTSYEGFMFILNGGPHPLGAKLFLNYALSPAGQFAQCKDVCSGVLNVPGTVLNPGYEPMTPLIAEATAAAEEVLGLMGLA